MRQHGLLLTLFWPASLQPCSCDQLYATSLQTQKAPRTSVLLEDVPHATWAHMQVLSYGCMLEIQQQDQVCMYSLVLHCCDAS